jgi:hypothetical protein
MSPVNNIYQRSAEGRAKRRRSPFSLIEKKAPPEKTYAEEFYYKKQMENRTPMVIKTVDDEEFRGWIEWYDKKCIKVNRRGAPNVLIRKSYIKYMYKEEEETAKERVGEMEEEQGVKEEEDREDAEEREEEDGEE